MKTITDIIFPKEFKTEAEEYIAYKCSLGFKFSMDDQRKLFDDSDCWDREVVVLNTYCMT